MQNRRIRLKGLADQLKIRWEMIETSRNGGSGKKKESYGFYQAAREDYERFIKEYQLLHEEALLILDLLFCLREAKEGEPGKMEAYAAKLEIMMISYEKAEVLLEQIGYALIVYLDEAPEI